MLPINRQLYISLQGSNFVVRKEPTGNSRFDFNTPFFDCLEKNLTATTKNLYWMHINFFGIGYKKAANGKIKRFSNVAKK